MNVFLDDIRNADTKIWTIVRTVDDCKKIIIDCHNKRFPLLLSLDHDLGKDCPTGYDLLNWLESEIYNKNLYFDKYNIKILLHTANPVGRKNMKNAVNSIYKMLGIS